MRSAGIDVEPDAAVSGLPYGLRKRIEVVRALMSRPRVLMLDEPAAGLNPRETAELSDFLKSVARDGLTLLVVEHDMSFVHDLCDRTVVLNFGRLIYDGPTQGVQENAQVRGAYLGSRRVATRVANRVA
jgi:branched-chain amino acid transport system ATP-binding protein